MAVNIAVNGTLMRGLELNPNMINAGATFVRETTTAAAYRLWSINNRHPAMIRVASGGAMVAVEVWAVPPEGLARIILQEPPGLCIGKVKLSDGEEILGVLGEPLLCEGRQPLT
jgi:gamma-glutamylcyclotransferase (GGCT)/AIG2-like uncharacterized protein YtfP